MPVVSRESRLFQLSDSHSSKLDKYWSACWKRHEETIQRGDAAALVEMMYLEPGAAAADFCSSQDMTLALINGALVASGDVQKRCVEYLAQNSRDRHAFSVDTLRKLVISHYDQLHAAVRPPLLKLVTEMIAWDASGADGLVLALLRQVAIGDLSEANTWLACTLLHTLRNAYQQWLCKAPSLLMQAVLYKYLRVLPDAARGTKHVEQVLSQSSIALCITILTEHWETCAAMGRDLVRALQAVCAIPEFKPLWKDLLAGWPPGRGDPAETAERIGTPDDALGLVLSSRTPQPLLQSALTHGMEKELFFIMSQVRMGNHRRYQQWFQARHLAQKECESVISDLVRFICGVYHPTNQIIASDVVQRWAMVGWLLQCARSPVQLANIKLALVYDLLLFQPQVDSIMNIEPAMLLMVHSIPKYSGMTNTILEFLILAKDHYNPARRHLTQRGFVKGMSALVQRGVVRNLDVLVKAEEVAPELRSYLWSTFRQFCSGPPSENKRPPPDQRDPQSPSFKRLNSNNHRPTELHIQDPPKPGLSNSAPSSPLANNGSHVLPGAHDSGRGNDIGAQSKSPGAPSGHASATPTADFQASDAEPGPDTTEDSSAARDEPLAGLQRTEKYPRITKAAARLKEEVGDMIDGELETGDLDLVSDALHLLDALVSDHNQESGGKPLGADSGALAAAVRAVLECSKICSDAGIEILDNIPTVAASTAPQPRAVSGDCLGGAILRACCAAHREGQHPARRAAASHLLAALQGSLRDLGTCLLAHALAEAHGSGRGDAEGNASSGVPGEQQPGEANERKEAIPECSAAYIKYAEAWSSRAAIANGEDEDTDEEDAGPSSSAQVLADDLRRCLRWGLEDATAVVLQLLLSEGPLVELAAGNPGVVELVAAAFMPQQVSLLAAALAARRSQLCFGPSTESSAAVCFEILQQSWGWDSHSQATMWLLLGFEAQGRGLSDSEELAIGCLESLASKAVPGPGPEFATGLMVLLRQLPATSRLVDCLLELPASCSEIAAAAFATWVAPGSALQVGPSGRDRRVTAIASAAAKAGKSRKGTVADVWGIKAQAAMGSAPGSVPAGDPVEIKKEKAAKPASSTTLQDVNSPRRSDQRNQESADGGPNQSAQQQDIESESDSSESDMD